MKQFGTWLALITLAFISKIAPAQAAHPEQPTYVSMLQLITVPEQFDGKRISVVGFLRIGREVSRIYLHQEDDKHQILTNSVTVDVTEQMGRDKARINSKYVKMLGIFHVRNRLSAQFAAGEITNIESCEMWSDPEHPISVKLKEIPGVTSSQ